MKAFSSFIHDALAQVLVCTHATFRFAIEKLGVEVFENTLIGIDEFHHVSTEGENVLGDCLDRIMSTTNAHVVAMTGSYFRGDNIAILSSQNEDKFFDGSGIEEPYLLRSPLYQYLWHFVWFYSVSNFLCRSLLMVNEQLEQQK